VKLIETKCLPVILYGLDACPVNASDKHSLDFVLTRSLMKLFQTGSNLVITECRRAFNLKLLSEIVNDRKAKFVTKYCECYNIICQLFVDTAKVELINLLARCS